ncbi:MAG TPA: glucose-6-phosphate dehydrogenase [Steroidobacteraceae bacterium]|nr:glucose-6-phosphate dehydrogenase [Steroidobacteraceae bacterium]
MPEFDLVLFGATGDLAMRKLLPALFRRYRAGQFPRRARILGIGRTQIERDEYVALVEESSRKYLAPGLDATRWTSFSRLLDYLQLDAASAADYPRLAARLAVQPMAVRVFFLSTAPALFVGISRNLAAAGLVTPGARIVLEKPLGQDRASADEINEQVGAIFPETQTYRIDHYLGKEAVQNLLALRFGNALFEPLWRRGRIRHVQITIGEQLGVEGRGAFYDQTGALRDMVQNHLLQLLCIMAMEPPLSNHPDAVRDEKLKVLRSLRRLEGPDVATHVVRGQYLAGAVGGKPVAGYLEEQNIPPDSTTETFVALKAYVDTWRWAGVPFYLRTGKRLREQVGDIVIHFEDVPHPIFESTASANTPNRLVISLQPRDSITLTLLAKTPGEHMRLRPVDLRLDMAETARAPQLDAYERLLSDVINGNLTLFMRRDELDAAWRWIDPIRAAWLQSDERPEGYSAGSWGPPASSALIGRDHYVWHAEP